MWEGQIRKMGWLALCVVVGLAWLQLCSGLPLDGGREHKLETWDEIVREKGAGKDLCLLCEVSLSLSNSSLHFHDFAYKI